MKAFQVLLMGLLWFTTFEANGGVLQPGSLITVKSDIEWGADVPVIIISAKKGVKDAPVEIVSRGNKPRMSDNRELISTQFGLNYCYSWTKKETGNKIQAGTQFTVKGLSQFNRQEEYYQSPAPRWYQLYIYNVYQYVTIEFESDSLWEGLHCFIRRDKYERRDIVFNNDNYGDPAGDHWHRGGGYSTVPAHVRSEVPPRSGRFSDPLTDTVMEALQGNFELN